MTRIIVALTTAMLFCLVGPAALAKSSDINSLLPKADEPAKKKRLPTIKTKLKQDKRWHLEPEPVHGRTPYPVFFIMPRAGIYPGKPKK